MVIVPHEPERLRRRWRHLCAWIGASGDVDFVFDRLVANYSHPSRHYHNLTHIEECLEVFAAYREENEGDPVVEAAIWFHDVIYDTTRSDNEERSADVAARELGALRVASGIIEDVRWLILITRHKEPPTRGDEMLIVDVDLAILGASPERFDEYERQIRAEYVHVDADAFRAGRTKVVQAFLARPTIYSTDRMRKDFEDQARRNLRRSIERLSGDRGVE